MLFSLYFWPVVESLIPIQGNLSPSQKKGGKQIHSTKKKNEDCWSAYLYCTDLGRPGVETTLNSTHLPPKNYLPLERIFAGYPLIVRPAISGKGYVKRGWVVGWPAMSHEGDVSKQDALMPCVCSFDSTSEGELLGPIHVNQGKLFIFTGRGRFFFCLNPKIWSKIKIPGGNWLQMAFW